MYRNNHILSGAIWLVSALLGGLGAFPCAAASAVQGDWPAPVTRARGWGRPPAHLSAARARLMARRAAEVTAVRNLARKLGLPPGSRVSGFTYGQPVYRPDGWVEVTVEYRPR